MSNARPHAPMPQGDMTPRQRRRFRRKIRRYQDVEILRIREHGGSGVPVRKPRQTETYTRDGRTYPLNEDESLTLTDDDGNTYTRV